MIGAVEEQGIRIYRVRIFRAEELRVNCLGGKSSTSCSTM